MITKIRNAPRKALNTAKIALSDKYAILNWATEGMIAENWGDKLNPWLAEKVSGKKIFHRKNTLPWSSQPVHYWIGSHLGTACSDPRSVVWGAGFISYDVPIQGKPGDIHAVRGWLSVKRLKESAGIDVDVVGDAALLLPRFYQPRTAKKKYALGIIPHCFEWNEPFFKKSFDWENVLPIDITGSIEEVVNQINSCDRIISSSLHGIICADAYNVPSIWLSGSDKPKGDGFKFRDYFSSVGRSDWDPIKVDASTSRAVLEKSFRDYSIDIDLDALWACCPLRNDR